MNPNQNPNCDNYKCTRPDGEVRLLPTGGGGNLILCHACYMRELAHRQHRNEQLGWMAFPLPAWVDLKVYEA